MITRFLTYPSCKVTLKGSGEACDRAELYLGFLDLNGDEEADKKKIDQVVTSYQKTNVEFPEIEYKKK